MNTPKEIERKWLINPALIPFDITQYEAKKIKQCYISYSPTIRLRNTNNTTYILCVKSAQKANSFERDEFELEITREQYEHLLTKAEGNVVEKTRYCVPDGKYVQEFDFFEGSLKGLYYMEVEFPNDKEAFAYATPAWAIKEVSDDHRYKNTALAKSGMPEDLR